MKPRLAKLAGQRADPLLMKGINAYTLLDLLRLREALSKSDLSRVISLSRPTASDQVAGLIELGIVVKQGQAESGRQAKRRPLCFGSTGNSARFWPSPFGQTASAFARPMWKEWLATINLCPPMEN